MATEAKVRMTRENTLDFAKNYVTNDRNIDNGDPEDNFGSIAEIWTWWLEKKYGITFKLTATDVAMLSMMIKIARLLVTETKHDNWIDIAGYAACGAETASIEELDKPILRDGGVAYTDDNGDIQVVPPQDRQYYTGPPEVEISPILTEEDEEAINIRIRKEMAAIAEERSE